LKLSALCVKTLLFIGISISGFIFRLPKAAIVGATVLTEQLSFEQAHQMKDVLMTPLEKAIKEDLKNEQMVRRGLIRTVQGPVANFSSPNEQKEKARQLSQVRDNYNSLHKKLKTIENDQLTGKKGTWRSKGVNPVKVAQDLDTSRTTFEKENIEFQTKLREVHTISRFDFMQRLAAFMYANKSNYQLGLRSLDDVAEDLLDVMRDMEEAKKVCICLSSQHLTTLVLKRECSSPDCRSTWRTRIRKITVSPFL
jgi:hypothetical protein